MERVELLSSNIHVGLLLVLSSNIHVLLVRDPQKSFSQIYRLDSPNKNFAASNGTTSIMEN